MVPIYLSHKADELFFAIMLILKHNIHHICPRLFNQWGHFYHVSITFIAKTTPWKLYTLFDFEIAISCPVLNSFNNLNRYAEKIFYKLFAFLQCEMGQVFASVLAIMIMFFALDYTKHSKMINMFTCC